MIIKTEIFVHFPGSNPHIAGKEKTLAIYGRDLGVEKIIVTFALIRENAQYLHYSL